MEDKPASSLVVSLGKALNRTPPLLCGRQVAQFSFQKKGWLQVGHQTVKTKCHVIKMQIICYGNPQSGKSGKKKKNY